MRYMDAKVGVGWKKRMHHRDRYMDQSTPPLWARGVCIPRWSSVRKLYDYAKRYGYDENLEDVLGADDTPERTEEAFAPIPDGSNQKVHTIMAALEFDLPRRTKNRPASPCPLERQGRGGPLGVGTQRMHVSEVPRPEDVATRRLRGAPTKHNNSCASSGPRAARARGRPGCRAPRPTPHRGGRAAAND
jgi:hypothetical protein